MKEEGSTEAEIIEAIFSNRNIHELNEYLESHPTLDLTQLTDSQGNTVLHQLAYEGHLDIIRLFAKQAKEHLQSAASARKKNLYVRDEGQEVSLWMNTRNKEGFTPLLYAAYNGHIDIIRYLVEEHRVNQNATTNSGLNALHLAAQRNMLLPFLYFRSSIDVNLADKVKTTPLHWASYMNSEQVVGYLLSLEELTSLDARDEEGNTPLMLAVNYGNTRIVRKLLIKGADRYLESSDGKTPLTIAKENEYKTITKMLNEEYTCLDMLKFYCNVKIEYRPKKRKLTFPLLFIVSFLVVVGGLNALLEFS